ncbi:MAG: BLUF domain-containing protein [Moraxellaceae bacterium]|nr:MAG: BLUF domain-containing protein [Moraxellaceae bacterium]
MSQTMPDLVRLTYASSTSSSRAEVQGDLVDILHSTQFYNAKHQIHGVLFYGNGYFFQCLEGQRKQVLKLYDKISNDPRHQDICILTLKTIEVSEFKQWQMKYVLEDHGIRHFFLNHYGQCFNPYLLKEDMDQQFVQLLLNHQAIHSADQLWGYDMVQGGQPVAARSGVLPLLVIVPIVIAVFMGLLSL